MRRVLASFGFGPHAELLQIAIPGFARYAAAHGYDLFIPQASFFSDEAKSRPASWMKIPLLKRLFGDGAESVLWLDADVVVKRFDKDISDDCGDHPLHMVVHRTNDGAVPNAGVMYMRSSFSPHLDSVWDRSGFARSGGWWEQAAVIDLLGGDPDATPVAVPAGPLWSELPYEWNPHVRDSRGVPAGCRFFHATSFPDRVSCMREAARDAAT